MGNNSSPPWESVHGPPTETLDEWAERQLRKVGLCVHGRPLAEHYRVDGPCVGPQPGIAAPLTWAATNLRVCGTWQPQADKAAARCSGCGAEAGLEVKYGMQHYTNAPIGAQ